MLYRTARLAARYSLRGTVGFAAVTSVAFGQAVIHERSYVPLPVLQAPEFGSEFPERVQRLAREKREALRRRLHEKREQAQEILRRMRRKDTQHQRSQSQSPTTHGPSRGGGVTPAGSSSSYRVLFVGDSLVTGVGGAQDDAREGPPLPRRVCRALAERLDSQVEWRALGLAGGDLRAIRKNLVPEILPGGGGGGFDVVVVMCGLNDFKSLARGELRTPWSFKDDLALLIDDIRSQVGPDCRIILPALPIALASFHEPLKSYIVLIANQWDKQKLRLASLSSYKGAGGGGGGGGGGVASDQRDDDGCFFPGSNNPSSSSSSLTASETASGAAAQGQGVEYVDVLTVEDRNRDGSSLVADDGVHPSESGYALWATHIANQIVAKEPPAVRARREEEAGDMRLSSSTLASSDLVSSPVAV